MGGIFCHWPSLLGVLGTLLGALIGFCGAIFAEPIRQAMYRPQLQLKFRPGDECHARTSEGQDKHDAIYLRVKVTNAKGAMAKACRAYLTAIEKRNASGAFENTVYCDSIRLAWACKAESEKYDGLDLPSKVSQFIDLLSMRSFGIGLHLQFAANRYQEILRAAGTYRFTVFVSGDNVKPAQIRVVYRKTDTWNDYDANEE
jgi:hypothetical protein